MQFYDIYWSFLPNFKEAINFWSSTLKLINTKIKWLSLQALHQGGSDGFERKGGRLKYATTKIQKQDLFGGGGQLMIHPLNFLFAERNQIACLWLLVNITYIYSKPKPVVNIINQKLDPFPRAWPNTTVAESDRTEDLNWIMAFQQRAGCALTTCKLMQPSLQPLEN